ncbi:hypothetical protein LTR56_010934 [Elasticomyces elasticus]|nr:hypothetical protein LTR56_010934 [Elasticomyces elasticus]KAK3662633.1 hypothetical protein LTR22_006483 [Elasticomyces elasticus]KAK4926583.1 hypothetical protein LTR49_006517 [Elasticomyces elasticus]KAK5760676.1 hypothetical protein LTS12_009213 [Elasticomyces elasticus]
MSPQVNINIGGKRKANGSRYRNDNEDSDDDQPMSKKPKSEDKTPKARFVQLRAHVDDLFDNAIEFTAQTQMVVEHLNKSHRVKRLSIRDFGRMDFVEAVGRLSDITAPADVDETRTDLHTAIFLEHGIIFDTLRVGLTGIAERADKVLRALEIVQPEAEAASRNSHGANIVAVTKMVEVYRSMLKDCSSLLAETHPAIEVVEQRYPNNQKHDSTRSTQRYGTWETRIVEVWKRMDDVSRVIRTSHESDVKRPTSQKPEITWHRRRVLLEAPLALVMMDLYQALGESYEAAFAAALELAPKVFAHPGWCTVE